MRPLHIGTIITIVAINLIACNNTGSFHKNTHEPFIAADNNIGPEASATADSTSRAPNNEGYDYIEENAFQNPVNEPLSTFSVDVDRASYSNVRRFINDGMLPPAGAIRIEEMINYFNYHYPEPSNDEPFSVNTEVATCPWNHTHQLVKLGLKGKEIKPAGVQASNLVFLIDVSGSMDEPDKLPLVQSSLHLLADQLRAEDNVAIVAYAGNAGLVLPSTKGSEKTKIKDTIDRLSAGGSTAGAAGIELAYKIAEENFKTNGNNRIILATDGDFNVGQSSEDELVRLIEGERSKNIFLTVLGFGTGNYQDNKMQQLADKGNGNHAYIDNINEAKKVLVNEFSGTLFTIAKDVKIQVEFNPAKVQAYRLIGYENRMLQTKDFNDDTKDAGEIGAGHTVTALYEIIPAGVADSFVTKTVDLKYQVQGVPAEEKSNELMTVKLRYKAPDSDESKLMITVVSDNLEPSWSDDFRLSAGVAEFGLLLRNSEYKQNASFTQLNDLIGSIKKADAEGYTAEFRELVKKAAALKENEGATATK